MLHRKYGHGQLLGGLLCIKDGNGELTKEEFMEGAAMDDSIVGALSMYQNLI